ncbi:GTP-binding protein [Tamlana crocina]
MEALITIVGFLGAGKTTLLKYLIEHFNNKAWNPYVILNDYENANMDVQHFREQLNTNTIKPLSGSCICCSGIVELRETVNRIPKRENGITLIEANGTSDACSLMEFLGVGLNDRFSPPIQVSVVDAQNWQKRGEHNELEANQIQVSSLIVLTHLEQTDLNRKKEVIASLGKINPTAKVIAMADLDIELLPELVPSQSTPQQLNHQKAHWASCSIDLPNLPSRDHIVKICNALPKTILRIKGCTKIGEANNYTFFERTPDGEIHIRPFNGVPITGCKLLTIGPGSEPLILERAIKSNIESTNYTQNDTHE